MDHRVEFAGLIGPIMDYVCVGSLGARQARGPPGEPTGTGMTNADRQRDHSGS